MPDRDVRITQLAHRQHGVLSLAQAQELGFTRAMVRARRDRNQWRALGHDVLVVVGFPFTFGTKVMVACLSTGGVASHQTAAALHELRNFRPGRVHVTVAHERRPRLDEVTVHRATDAGLFVPIRINGIPVTPLDRTLVDLAGSVPTDHLIAAIDQLVGRRALGWDDLLRAIERHERRGRRGPADLRAIVAGRLADEVPETVLEQVFLRLVATADLPLPVGQYEIHDERGFVARVDFAYPEVRVAIELDSVEFHRDRPTFERDRAKRNRLVAQGWTVLAFTWRMVIGTPTDVLAQLERCRRAAA